MSIAGQFTHFRRLFAHFLHPVRKKSALGRTPCAKRPKPLPYDGDIPSGRILTSDTLLTNVSMEFGLCITRIVTGVEKQHEEARQYMTWLGRTLLPTEKEESIAAILQTTVKQLPCTAHMDALFHTNNAWAQRLVRTVTALETSGYTPMLLSRETVLMKTAHKKPF